MPRKSAEAIAGDWFRAQNAPPPPPHPEPPAYFSPAAAEHWREIVASKPYDYFDAANRHLLEALCVTISVADAVWAEIHACDPSDPKQLSRYQRLVRIATRQSSMMAMLLSKLRLLPSRAGTMPQMARSRMHIG
jgi:phage terminase small subunit